MWQLKNKLYTHETMELNLIPAIQKQFEQEIQKKTSYGRTELPEILKSAIIQVLSDEIEKLRAPEVKEKKMEYRKGNKSC
jgi:hypothetical protein